MGSMSLIHWVIVLAIVVLLFGAGRLPNVMGDFAKGIKAFRQGMKDEDEPAATDAKKTTIPHTAAPSVAGEPVRTDNRMI